MKTMFHDGSRELQDRFDTRRLADRIEGRLVHGTISDSNKAFLEKVDMFFLATADEEGRPNCSYKGGAPGFVRVVDEKTIAFPIYASGDSPSSGSPSATDAVPFSLR